MHNLRSDHPLCLTWQRGRLRSARGCWHGGRRDCICSAGMGEVGAAACRTPHTLRVKEEQSNKVQASG